MLTLKVRFIQNLDQGQNVIEIHCQSGHQHPHDLYSLHFVHFNYYYKDDDKNGMNFKFFKFCY